MATQRTNKSYRYAIEPHQGIAFIENTGSAWLYPPARAGKLVVYDSDGQQHTLVLDMVSGFWHDISTREGPSDTGLSKIAKDKVAVNGTGGTNVSCSVWFKEDRGSVEKYFLVGKEFHIYTRPEDESKRDASGYGSLGYPDGFNIDLDIYTDGNPSTVAANANDVPIPGAISFDRRVEAHRLQIKATSNMGEHVLVGRQDDCVAEDRVENPSGLVMSEMNYEEAFKTPDLWPDIVNGTLRNRVTGREISVTYTAASDPTGYTRALRITAATTLGSASLTGSGVLLIWYNGAISVTIGGVAVVLTTHATSGSWTLAYANGLTASGNLIVTPTGATADVWDIRTIDSAITTNQRTYYYTNIIDHSGDVMIPR